MTAYEQAVEEIRAGQLSILSEGIQDKLVRLFQSVAAESFETGKAQAEETNRGQRRTW